MGAMRCQRRIPNFPSEVSRRDATVCTRKRAVHARFFPRRRTLRVGVTRFALFVGNRFGSQQFDEEQRDTDDDEGVGEIEVRP